MFTPALLLLLSLGHIFLILEFLNIYFIWFCYDSFHVLALADVCIVGVARTPMGGFLGTLSSLPATKLGSIVIECKISSSLCSFFLAYYWKVWFYDNPAFWFSGALKRAHVVPTLYKRSSLEMLEPFLLFREGSKLFHNHFITLWAGLPCWVVRATQLTQAYFFRPKCYSRPIP